MEVGWESMDWICLLQGRDHCWAPVNMVMNHQFLWKVENLLSSQAAISVELMYNTIVHISQVIQWQ
jgi:hypothetical protein